MVILNRKYFFIFPCSSHWKKIKGSVIFPSGRSRTQELMQFKGLVATFVSQSVKAATQIIFVFKKSIDIY